ncbi:MAG TPA: hypothetical protein HA346_01810 [Thermoplasmata archaeon]|nr:hypothetical protein [Thermoplasmata archaeon]
MGIDKIIERIEQSAGERIGAILKEAERQVKEIKERAKREAEEAGKKLEVETEEKCGIVEERLTSNARQQAKREMLLTKEELIKEAFDRAREKLTQLKESEYREILKKMLEEGKRLAGAECVVVPCKAKDGEYIKSLGYQVSKESVKGSGGAIIRSKDGSISVDQTFEGIIDRNWNELRIKVARALFS